ncbi:GlsB/YeaQ/YmgE family stress response membrane protein [Streptomyces zingiberis]|uniref:GlsB/YeaQ/YmgE family stress response membrane protein n=1 Tax=Streptomyces zingiberis TaxID=2053010 RepID=A0ABX1C0I3_9ACTN|nr:GlsB/YeaQ/YmgE family stress response membrane protein [Streptomyces zingiberis]NJQ02088.1 GlsB/YeaQ/YmgE family stress response membrane protein [Streptomyces zingiberis]
MTWLWAIVLGLILGLLAKLIIPGKQPIPLWLTTLCGMAGALIGNLVAQAIGVSTTPGIDWLRHVFQLGGAILVVALVSPFWAGHKAKKVKQRA